MSAARPSPPSAKAGVDGRHVGFWGARGNQTRTVRLYCPTEGNQDRVAYCNQKLVCADTGAVVGDPNSICDDPTTRTMGSPATSSSRSR